MQINDFLLISENYNLLKSPLLEKELGVEIQYNFETFKGTGNEKPIMVTLEVSIMCEKEKIVYIVLKYYLSIIDASEKKEELEKFIINSLAIEIQSEINKLLLKSKVPPLPLNSISCN